MASSKDYVTKYVQLTFADPKVSAVKQVKYLDEAIAKAHYNLRLRHGVKLSKTILCGDKVLVEVSIPKEIVSDFSLGNHLRGISSYLLKTYPSKYRKYLMGVRLLNYTEVDAPAGDPIVPGDKGLYYVSLFVELLMWDDEESKSKVKRIVGILNE